MKVFLYQTWFEPYSKEDCPIFAASEELNEERQKELAIELLVERFGYKNNTKESIAIDWNDNCAGCYLTCERPVYSNDKTVNWESKNRQ